MIPCSTIDTRGWLRAGTIRVLAVAWLGAVLTAVGAEPLTRAHSHNDYEHANPLHDALAHGFWSVEADIWLTNGQLLVAHDLKNVTPAKTLETLYLKPLQEFAKTNARAFTHAGSMTLLIDVKSDATNTWQALRPVLERYTNLLTRFDATGIHSNAVTVILSGNRATETLATEPVRYAAIDGRLPDLTNNPPTSLVPLVSDNWTKAFTWRGQGEMTSTDRDRLADFVKKAHEQGRRIRFWAAPDGPVGWTVLRDAGVDVLNTDKLAELESFLGKP